MWTGVAGTPAYTNLYFDGSGGNQQAQIDLVRDFFTSVAGLIDNAITVTVEGDVSQIDDVTGNVTGVGSFTTRTVLGTDAGAAMPPATQVIVHWLTSTFIGGRQLRGKTFLGYISTAEGDSAGGLLTASRTVVINAANALVAASNAVGNLQVWSRKNGLSSDVTATLVPSKFAVLRSRRD